MTIDAYLEAMQERFVTDPLVTHFQVLRERSTLMDGYLRVQLTLANGSQLELSEYMQRSSAGEMVVLTYSYHWADANNRSSTGVVNGAYALQERWSLLRCSWASWQVSV
jgi:hypothetical protein